MISLSNINDILLIAQACISLGVLLSYKNHISSLYLLIQSIISLLLYYRTSGITSEACITSLILVIMSILLLCINMYLNASISIAKLSIFRLNVFSGIVIFIIFLLNIKNIEFLIASPISQLTITPMDLSSLLAIAFTFFSIIASSIIIITNSYERKKS